MRGQHDSSSTFPFEVRPVAANLPFSKGGFRVFNVNTQEFINDKGEPYDTDAEAKGAAYSAYKAHKEQFGNG